jgi:ATP-dependent Lhr-like helicase
VVLVDGDPVLFLEKGGRSLLQWEHSHETVQRAAAALVRDAARLGVGRAVIQRVNGAAVPTESGPFVDAGFLPTPRGLRLRTR